MAAKALAETHPTQASHLGVPKSTAESATSKEPAASAKWTAIPDPPPNSTWVNTAIGRANRRTIEPRKPLGERMPEPSDLWGLAAAHGGVPTPPDLALGKYSVMTCAPYLACAAPQCPTNATLW